VTELERKHLAETERHIAECEAYIARRRCVSPLKGEAETESPSHLGATPPRFVLSLGRTTPSGRVDQMTACIRRRGFITLIGGAAVVWPLAARAQQGERVRRIGVLMHLAADDPEGQRRVAAFLQGLQEAGWAVGRNVDIDVRWAAGEADRNRRYAMEIVALTPDVILTSAPPSIRAMQQATSTVPIVFVLVPDAVGTGIVDSLSRPGGNTTGFTSTELGMPVKWLELLKEIAPKMTRAAVLRDVADATAIGQFGAVKGTAPSFSVEISAIGVGNAKEIERGITAFAREPNGGLIVLPVPTTVMHRSLIIMLAAQHRLPAVYNSRFFAAEGGLVSYGPNVLDQYRRTAGYVDRILRGTKPADLPVQAPTKYELVINLKTAKALGIEVPPTLLARADEVIE
jgi:putative tryptophan/tyrosine transport system substrate-binding protein